jgi:outer membrane PBP1 activator LpoA protein
MSPRRSVISIRAALASAFLALAALTAGCAGGPGHAGIPSRGVTTADRVRGTADGYVTGETVAVLLPQSGRFSNAAEAVRSGIVAAQRAEAPSKRPSLRFYDSSDPEAVPALVRRAAADGAKLVIGPLQKQAVDQLAASGALPVPTLALNAASGAHMPPANLYQFALSPEDEAAEVANRAWANGYRRALMLYPEGPWGNRIAGGFRQQWAALGGRIVAGQIYDPNASDASESIKRLLGLPGADSGQGADADFIFLVATAQKAREIWPQIRSIAGSRVPPVYCTSHIYSTRLDAQGVQELAGLYFVDIPWLIAPARGDALSLQNLERDLPQVHGDYIRLYAMGIDAYRIAPRLGWMSEHPKEAIGGETGTLRLDSLRRVRRELPLARMEATGPVLASGGIPPLSTDRIAGKDGHAKPLLAVRPVRVAATTP